MEAHLLMPQTQRHRGFSVVPSGPHRQRSSMFCQERAIPSRERGHGNLERAFRRLVQIDIEDLAIQKENSCRCLRVGGGCYMSLRSVIRKEGVNLRGHPLPEGARGG